MSDTLQYRLSGFGPGIDWQYTWFEEPFPRVRVCSVCGVVPKKVALLPCCHPLCGYCLGGSVARGKECPLDKKEFSEQLIQWLEFTEEEIAQLKLRCRRGGTHCDFDGPLTSHPHHDEECGFHSVECTICFHSCPRKDIVEHTDKCRSAQPDSKKASSEHDGCNLQ